MTARTHESDEPRDEVTITDKPHMTRLIRIFELIEAAGLRTEGTIVTYHGSKVIIGGTRSQVAAVRKGFEPESQS